MLDGHIQTWAYTNNQINGWMLGWMMVKLMVSKQMLDTASYWWNPPLPDILLMETSPFRCFQWTTMFCVIGQTPHPQSILFIALCSFFLSDNRSVPFPFHLGPNVSMGLRSGLWVGQAIICIFIYSLCSRYFQLSRRVFILMLDSTIKI